MTPEDGRQGFLVHGFATWGGRLTYPKVGLE